MTRKGFANFISIINYLIFLIVIIVCCDVIIFRKILDKGYARHFEEENMQRFPYPYIEFKGKPKSLDHNELGFRGRSPREANADDLKIEFWGGSTGYNGDPPIAKVIENELQELLGINVFVLNCSIVSSIHRQHLHGIIEILPQFKPDIIIFYGGYNETFQRTSYDPRPGYPYNYFYRAETPPFIKVLIENSAIAGEFDKNFGILTGINKLQEEQKLLSESWNKRIVEKYFETLTLANNITGAIESKYFGKAKFFSFYQPYQVPSEFVLTHEKIKQHSKKINFVYDVSDEYDLLGEKIYNDIVHVNQQAKQKMGKKIAQILYNQLQNENKILQKRKAN